MQAGMGISLLLLANDVTGVGVADDVLIPPIMAGTAITAGAIWAANEIYKQYAEHKKNKRKSKADQHTQTRSGGDPEAGRYGRNRNDNRGNKNQKYIPSPNPNKRRK